jgi:hypothetical protein
MVPLKEITRYLTPIVKDITCLSCGETVHQYAWQGDQVEALHAQCRTCTAVFSTIFEFRRHGRVQVVCRGRPAIAHQSLRRAIRSRRFRNWPGLYNPADAPVGAGRSTKVFVLDDADELPFEEIVITRVWRGRRRALLRLTL